VIGKRFKGDPTALVRLARRLREIAPHIVQTWLFAGNSYGRVAARWAAVPAVIASERCVDVWKNRAQLLVDRWLAAWTDRLVVNSEAVKRFYVEQKIPADKLRVVANAIPATPQADGEAVAAVKRELSIPDGALVVGFIGRLWPQKRVDDLISAVDALRIAGWPVRLIVAGDGPQRQMLQRFARSLQVEACMQFLGHRTDADALHAVFDVFVLPSEFEGMPNVVLEAMRAGKPVVAARIAGMDEVVVDGETGLLTPPRKPFEMAKAIHKLFGDELLRRRLGEAGKRRAAEAFSVERMTSQYALLYEELATQKPAPSATDG
jgi:glycosyltransferase involved in cell wall biosynthesis